MKYMKFNTIRKVVLNFLYNVTILCSQQTINLQKHQNLTL